MPQDLKAMYKTIMEDHFPGKMTITFGEGKDAQQLVYEKVSWVIDGVRTGMRYGENPGQEAALYRLVNGNLAISGNLEGGTSGSGTATFNGTITTTGDVQANGISLENHYHTYNPGSGSPTNTSPAEG